MLLSARVRHRGGRRIQTVSMAEAAQRASHGLTGAVRDVFFTQKSLPLSADGVNGHNISSRLTRFALPRYDAYVA